MALAALGSALIHRLVRRDRLHARRWLSTNAEYSSFQTEFAGPNAYELLGVSETSSFSEIKSSFHKLAKETHPDLAYSHNESFASKKFIQVLAAYEILSDSKKRAHYDQYLLSQRELRRRQSKKEPIMYKHESYGAPFGQMEVVEWLKWYRYAVNDILSERSLPTGSGYFDVLQRDFYSAIHAAYYGPEIQSLDLLPDCFEAEERSTYATTEVLHLVSGRDLFGMVCLANTVPQLSHAYNAKLTSFAAVSSQCDENISEQRHSDFADGGISQKEYVSGNNHESDAYKNLELHVSGRLVAVASRVPPKSSNGLQDENSEDRIHVYLYSHEEQINPHHMFQDDTQRIPLGTITGLGTSPEEGTCHVYSGNGVKTHVILKHRTLLVKHMHWYQDGEMVSVCECRCSRARLPPSKFWLFEPRCETHDIGGWYVETFGRDMKGRIVPSQRFWDGLDTTQHLEKRLHPAIYLIALAYRTLDIETARKGKQTLKDMVGAKMYRALSWCKKLV